MSTDVTEPIEKLISAGVLTETEEGLAPTEAFVKKREKHQAKLDDHDSLKSARTKYAGVTSEERDLGPRVLANALTLADITSDISDEMCLQFSFLFARFDGETPVSGVPEGFIPIKPSEIEDYLSVFPTSVLYFWREDANSCKTAREDLEQLVYDDAYPNTVGRAAIYGPESPDILEERYNVTVAPTILFTVDGSIDSRYIGPKTPRSYKNEIDIIVERSSDIS